MSVSCSQQSDSQTRDWHKFSKLKLFSCLDRFLNRKLFCNQKNNKPSGAHRTKLRTNSQVQTERAGEDVH